MLSDLVGLSFLLYRTQFLYLLQLTILSNYLPFSFLQLPSAEGLCVFRVHPTNNHLGADCELVGPFLEI